MIKLEGLTKNFGGTLAIDNLSFEVAEGDVFGFIGPNGAGKTTTIRILSTVLDPTRGTAFIAGHSILDEPEKVRGVIGYMPDFYGLYDGIEVWEYLDFFARAYRLPRKQRRRVIDDVLELTDLGALSTKLVGTLSKGMKQRVCLAKTLLHDPQVLILDEPAAGLDPRGRIELRALLKELARMGKTIFISSHILTELGDICNSVGIIEKGKLLVCGDIEEIARTITPLRTLAIKVVKKVAEAAEFLKTYDGVTSVEVEKDSLGVRFRGDDEDIARLLQALLAQGVSVVGLAERTWDLESIFMGITKGDLA
jgi:ABC-2 type transport system ATP-binding protein